MMEKKALWLWPLMFTWELPQTILGGILLLIYRKKLTRWILDIPYAWAWTGSFRWGVSLGQIIVLGYIYNYKTVLHEHGHSMQSLYLGPLYLLVIGLPSITFNILGRLGMVNNSKYYDRPWEAWADRLGGVDRREDTGL
jgi:hypothetical protein